MFIDSTRDWHMDQPNSKQVKFLFFKISGWKQQLTTLNSCSPYLSLSLSLSLFPPPRVHPHPITAIASSCHYYCSLWYTLSSPYIHQLLLRLLFLLPSSSPPLFFLFGPYSTRPILFFGITVLYGPLREVSFHFGHLIPIR